MNDKVDGRLPTVPCQQDALNTGSFFVPYIVLGTHFNSVKYYSGQTKLDVGAYYLFIKELDNLILFKHTYIYSHCYRIK